MTAVVDTRAFLSSVPGPVLRQLDVPPRTRDNFRLADGLVKSVDIGYTWLRLNGIAGMTYVAFNNEASNPLFGALALEELWLEADPQEGKLIPLMNIPL